MLLHYVQTVIEKDIMDKRKIKEIRVYFMKNSPLDLNILVEMMHSI